ncbi:hypothetical protein LCGC14_1494620 [marine sediment metagenome]|uniref:Uncharacterized protein n=1 Tax=marine sediment metagenome TaxID=412755 RepID=A0A0F9J5T3_9ZZZZ
MSKYFAVAATNKKVKEAGGGTFEFADSALDQMAESAPKKPILIAFDTRQVGMVASARNDHGKLCVIMDIKKEYSISKEQRLVPGFTINQDEWTGLDGEDWEIHRMIQGVDIYAFGLTLAPAEKDLPEIEKK